MLDLLSVDNQRDRGVLSRSLFDLSAAACFVRSKSTASRIFSPRSITPQMPGGCFVLTSHCFRATNMFRLPTTVDRQVLWLAEPRSGDPTDMPEGATEPNYRPCRQLDYEVELGIYIGVKSDLGVPVGIENALEHVFGFSILNDWSARDVQSWEYQPLGPFLGKIIDSLGGLLEITRGGANPLNRAPRISRRRRRHRDHRILLPRGICLDRLRCLHRDDGARSPGRRNARTGSIRSRLRILP